MKRIVLVDASPRKGGNSEIVVDALAEQLMRCKVTVFKMRDHDCRTCLACAACQKKDAQMCVQQDVITPLLPMIDGCDAVVVASPIYNQQITSLAKLLIERFYPFFNVEKKNKSNTSKADGAENPPEYATQSHQSRYSSGGLCDCRKSDNTHNRGVLVEWMRRKNR